MKVTRNIDTGDEKQTIRTISTKPKEHFEGRWKSGRLYPLYSVVVNNGTTFISQNAKMKEEPYVIYDADKKEFKAPDGWLIKEMSADSRVTALGGGGEGGVTPEEVEEMIKDKVDKVDGKGLSTNDYDNTEKNKVASAYQKPNNGIPKSDLAKAVQDVLDDADGAYKKPVTGIPFTDLADGVQDSLSNADEAKAGLAGKQDTISDLSAIRSGAAAGATSVQPAEFNELKDEVDTIGNGAFEEAWDGDSTPVVADIPAGVVVTYSSASYTGTLAASASTVDKIYLVSDGNGNYDRYTTVEANGAYSWKKVGSTAIPLSNYATKTKVNQLEAEVTDLDSVVNGVTPGTLREIEYDSEDSFTYNINANGYFLYNATNYLCCFVPITPGKSYIVRSSSYIAVLRELPDTTVHTNQQAKFATGFSGRILLEEGVDYPFTAPDNGNYLFLFIKNVDPLPSLFEVLLGNVGLVEKVEKLENELDYSQTVSTTKKIIDPVTAGKELYYNFSNKGNKIACIGFFDENNAIIGSWIGNPSSSGSAGNYEGIVTVPSGAAYLKATVSNDTPFYIILYYCGSSAQRLSTLYNVGLLNYKESEFYGGEYLFNNKTAKTGDWVFYDFDISGQGSAAFIELFDSGGNRLAVYGKLTQSSTKLHFSGDFEIPQDFSYARLTVSHAELGNIVTINALEFDYGNKSLMHKVSNLGTQKDVFDKDILIFHGYYLRRETGTISVAEAFSSSDYINISGATKIRVPYAGQSVSTTPLAFYDRNKRLISAVQNISGSFSLFEMQVPEGANYIRVCCQNTNENYELTIFGKTWPNENDYGLFPNPFVGFGDINSKVIVSSADSIPGLPKTRCAGSIAKNGNIVYTIATCTPNGYDSGKRISVFKAYDVLNDEAVVSNIVFDGGDGAYMNEVVFYDEGGVLGPIGTLYAFAIYHSDYTKNYVDETDPDDLDFVYKTSSDGGATWSEAVSLKSLLPNGYLSVGCSPSNPIVLNNGTFCLPGFFMKNQGSGVNKYRSGLITKKVGYDWKAIPLDIDNTNVGDNETCIVEYGNNAVMLNIRPAYSSYARAVYYTGEIIPGEDFAFHRHPSSGTFEVPNRNLCQGSITKFDDFYFLSTVDFTCETDRDNILLYVSPDACKWYPLLYYFNGFTRGYSHLLVYNNRLLVMYESENYTVDYADLTDRVNGLLAGGITTILKNTPDWRLLQVAKFREDLIQ